MTLINTRGKICFAYKVELSLQKIKIAFSKTENAKMLTDENSWFLIAVTCLDLWEVKVLKEEMLIKGFWKKYKGVH